MLTIHLEETDCFAAWVSAKEAGMGPAADGTDAKCETKSILISNTFDFAPRLWSGFNREAYQSRPFNPFAPLLIYVFETTMGPCQNWELYPKFIF